jgi:GT2 family glycosyltransferase
VPVEVRAPVPARGAADPPLGSVVADAVDPAATGPGDWVWLLADDSYPEPDALAALLDAAASSSGVGVVGPKLIDRDNPRRLLSFGQSLTPAGRPVGADVRGQLDQGQFDERRDVLGVPVAGMLVRTEVLSDVGGFDPAFGDGVEGLDLCWRAHLAGHRVVLAPTAYVRQGEAGLGVRRPLVTRRRTRQLAIARGSFWWGPVRSLAVLVTSLLAALGLLLAKRPRAAAGELADVSGVLAPWRGLGARWRFRRRRRVRRRDLRGLFASRRVAWEGTTEAVTDVLTPRVASAPGAPVVETGPVADEAESLDSGRRGPWWSWPLATAVLVAGTATVVRWRDHWSALGGGAVGIRTGELRVVDADAGDLWHAWWDGWSGAGLGQAAPAEPWLLPLAGVTWLVERLPWTEAGASSAGVAVAWLLFLAVPAAAVSAYLAAGSVTAARWPRAATALVWALLPPLSGAVAEGRLGPAVVHVLAPPVVAGVVSAIGRDDGARRTTATFGAALALAVAALFVPSVLALGVAAGLLVLLVAPGWSRLRGLVLAVVPPLLVGPWLGAAFDEPRLLLGGAGATTTQLPVEPWQALLLHAPGELPAWLWWTAPVILLGLLGAVRRGPRGTRAGLLVLVALLGLAGAVAAPLLVAGRVPEGYTDAGGTVTAWPGTFLSLCAAGLVLAACSAVDRVGSGPGSSWRRPVLTVVATLALLAPVAAGAWASWEGLGPGVEVAEPEQPAVVTEQTHGAEAARLLELVPADTRLDYRLVGDEPGPWVRDRVRELSPLTSPPPAEGEEYLDTTVRALVGHQDAGVDVAGLQERLHALAVGYVGYRGAATDPVTERLDAVPGLTRLGGGGSDLVLWRVAALGDDEDALVGAARVRVLDPSGTPLTAVRTDRPHAGTDAETLEEVPSGATLVVSEGAGWADAARVRLDGTTLQAVAGSWPPAYELDGPGTLSIELPPADRTWHLVSGGLALVVAFLALPLGGGRRRSER